MNRAPATSRVEPVNTPPDAQALCPREEGCVVRFLDARTPLRFHPLTTRWSRRAWR